MDLALLLEQIYNRRRNSTGVYLMTVTFSKTSLPLSRINCMIFEKTKTESPASLKCHHVHHIALEYLHKLWDLNVVCVSGGGGVLAIIPLFAM